MKEKLISVIIPCYNTAPFIDKCINSVLNQTYKNIELILVEDCSTDNTKQVLKKYEKYDNIKIIYNNENHGLSYNRNLGLENSKGDYISFIDSDDYIDNKFYEVLIKEIEKENSDFCVCDIMTVYSNSGEKIVNKAYNNTKDNLGIINTGLSASACNKLFKREVILKNKFEIGKYNEDLAVILPIIANSKKIAYAEGIYYYYIQHKESIQNSRFSDKRFDIIDGVDLTISRINKKNKNYHDIIDAIIYNQIILLLIYVIPKEKNIFKRTKILKKYNKLTKKYCIRQNKYLWQFLENCGKKHKIYYKALLKLNCNSCSFLASLLIFIYDCLYKIKLCINNGVIKKCDDKHILKYAKRQAKLKETDISISVIIPNYNYAKFMCERLCSILSQNIKIYEIIILDDKSTDNSIDIIEKYKKILDKYINVKVIYNKTNSGTPFKQWKKGFENATGKYVWIAEADDYCDKKMLNELVKPIRKNNDIIISYVDTAFIDKNGKIILKSIKPEIDILKTGHWDNSYVNDGLNEITNYTFLNNTIANVSSCLIKNGDYSQALNQACEYRQAGDWLFYLNLMSKGKVAFSKKCYNYYRVHGNNVSSTINQKKHIEEIKKIYSYTNENFVINNEKKKLMSNRINYLKKCWKID